MRCLCLCVCPIYLVSFARVIFIELLLINDFKSTLLHTKEKVTVKGMAIILYNLLFFIFIIQGERRNLSFQL